MSKSDTNIFEEDTTMKIRQNFVLAYFIPLIIVFFALITIPLYESASQVSSVLFIALIILGLCVLEWRTTTLEINNGLIVGHTGLIKKQTLSSPVSKIQYCEYTRFLFFNKIRLNAITGQYTFKNMSQAAKFVNLVNNTINSEK